ncbi:hypothetical protein [Aurantimonas phage AmM-1]|uniref:Rz-like spanin n=1 Tax=Aurantimonas phage AmM-1 TaxID=1503929 RepID=UPI000540C52B|nr:Rz-like spanin [Aurantimonas phage AmM-1]BAP94487.1 hypothetical protein [Aurantimonas phage AmM-1]
MVRRILIVVMAGALLAGCTAQRGSFCETAEPIRPSRATIAAMSDGEVAALLAHNETGEALCGWRP